MTRQEKLDRIQAIQNELFALYRVDENPDNPLAVDAGLLAWEATRLFWYAMKGDRFGVAEKLEFVEEGLRRVENDLPGEAAQ